MILHTEGETLNDKIDYLYPIESENMKSFIDREPFFKWFKDNIKHLTESMENALVFNLILLKMPGLEYLNELIKDMDKERKEKILNKYKKAYKDKDSIFPVSYEVAKQFGYEGEVKSGVPAVLVINERKKVMMKNRGIGVYKIGLDINANVFAKYLLKRIVIFKFIDGSTYIYDKKGYYVEVPEEFIKKICRNILHEAEDNIWIRKWEGEYYEALMREISYINKLNPNTEYINVKNGMLNIYTRELKGHDPKYFSTIQIPIEYNKEKECPMFKGFLLDVFDKDIERVKVIQEVIGNCFLYDIKIQKSFIFYGSGSNGKSVLATIIRQLVGIDNVSNVSLNELGGRFGMQNLPNKLVNISTENEFDKSFNTQNFKALTGGDAVNIEKKYKTSFSTVLFAKLIVLVNKMMETNDLSEGYYRRLQIIPFNKTFREKKAGEKEKENISYMDKELTIKLLSELDGILNFALDGLDRLIENDYNLTQSKKCEESLKKYINSQNPTNEFFKDRVIVDDKATTSRPKFRSEFCNWALDNGYDDWANVGATKFWDLFKNTLRDNDVKIAQKKIRGCTYIQGLSINAGCDNEYLDTI